MQVHRLNFADQSLINKINNSKVSNPNNRIGQLADKFILVMASGVISFTVTSLLLRM